MKRTNTYLIFDGNCRQAMKFYQECLGGELQLLPYSEMPPGVPVPKEAKDRIMHSRLTKGDAILMAMDTSPDRPLRQGNNFSISIECDNVEEIERLFKSLSMEGKVTMPLEETFWAKRFAMLTDRFGINWMLDLEKPAQ
jgi:PhnB protein